MVALCPDEWVHGRRDSVHERHAEVRGGRELELELELTGGVVRLGDAMDGRFLGWMTRLGNSWGRET